MLCNSTKYISYDKRIENIRGKSLKTLTYSIKRFLSLVGKK